MIQDYLILGFRNLRKRKLRAWLTIIGILISIATLFVLISVSLGLQGAVAEQFRLLGTDKFIIQPKGQIAGPGSPSSVFLTKKDVEIIEKISGVKDLSYFVAGNAQVEFTMEKRFFFVVGIPLDKSDVFLELGAYKPDEGSLFNENENNVVMLGSQFKYNNLFSKPVHAKDKILVNNIEFKVKTILKPVGNPGDDRNILIPLKNFNEIFNKSDTIDQILVQIEQGQDLKVVAERVEKKLRTSRDVTEKTQDFTILTPEELLAIFGTILNVITGFLLGVAGISLLVGGIGIANTMYTSVLERTKEIGVMKAVGAKNSDILSIFLVESGLLGLTGGVIGVILGISISKTIEFIAVNQLGTTLLKAAVPLYLIVGCLLFAFFAGAISGVWPAWKASKIRPVEALRYE